MKRFPFLDWTRGLAVIIMIECHVFNSFTRMDLRTGSTYLLSQFIGGMAAVLFLFMAGMTLAFQMDSLDRREPLAGRRWLAALRRGGYVLGIAYGFRLTNYLAGLPRSTYQELLKVDILNCMGVGMSLLAVAAVFPPKRRVQFAALTGLILACAAPLLTGANWSGVPVLLQNYLKPSPLRFPLFPWIAYLAFGLAAGAILKRTAAGHIERLMQWAVLVGFGMVFSAQYFSNLPYSLYARADFWIDSPALVLSGTGISLLALAAAYLWTEFCVGAGWSWMQSVGKTSLLVYWVHVMMVYGDLVKPLKAALSIPQVAASTLLVTASMVALSAASLSWKSSRGRKLAVKVASARAA